MVWVGLADMYKLTKSIFLAVAALGLVAGVQAAFIDAGVTTSWGYKGNIGPQRWSQLNPAFTLCATGKQQSPIDIPKHIKSMSYDLAIRYQNAPLNIVNDGQTELSLGVDQLIINDGHSIQLNFPQKPALEKIDFNDVDYHLLQLHFHSPSENLWHGQDYPLEIHFVHQGPAGKVLVLAVFVKSGLANPALQTIINYLPKEHGQSALIANQSINPADLLPESNNYYYVQGSLTTPPCSEGVNWVIMSTSITASPAQIQQLRQAMGGGNARPVQPLFKRDVFNSREN